MYDYIFVITYVKDGVVTDHNYHPHVLEVALRAGYELVRDGVADFFKVTRYKRS